MSVQEREAILQALRGQLQAEQEAQGVTHEPRTFVETAGKALAGGAKVVGDIGQSAAVGLASGVADTVQSGELFIADVLESMGAVNPKTVKGLEDNLHQARRRRSNLQSKQDFPTVAGIAKFGTEAAMLGGGAAGISKGVRSFAGQTGVSAAKARTLGRMTAGAATGSFVDEEDRVGGAIKGAALGFGIDKAGNFARNSTPEQIRPGTGRANMTGRDPTTESKFAMKLGTRKLDNTKSVTDNFKGALQTQKERITAAQEHWYGNSVKSKELQGVTFDTSNLKKPMLSKLDALRRSKVPAAKNMADDIDEFLDGPKSLEDIHNLTKSGTRFDRMVSTIGRADVDAKFVAQGVRKDMVDFIRTKLEATPKLLKKFNRGKTVSQGQKKLLEKHELTAAMEDGDIDSFITKVVGSKKESAKEVYKMMNQLTGNRKQTNAILMRGMYDKSTKGGVFDPKKFNNMVADSRAAGVVFDKETQGAANHLAKLMKNLEARAESKGFSVRGPSGPFTDTWNGIKNGVGALLDTRAGVGIINTLNKMSTKRAVKTERYNVIMDAILGAATKGIEQKPEGNPEKDAILKALRGQLNGKQ